MRVRVLKLADINLAIIPETYSLLCGSGLPANGRKRCLPADVADRRRVFSNLGRQDRRKSRQRWIPYRLVSRVRSVGYSLFSSRYGGFLLVRGTTTASRTDSDVQSSAEKTA